MNYMKKVCAIFLMFAALQKVDSCCHMNFQNLLATSGVGIGGYWELTPTYYPKTVAYFDALKLKYQVLKSIPILILDGPMADDDTIYFPMSWIEELEKGNTFYKDATEWIILHEAGHIVHGDVVKRGIATWIIIGGYLGAVAITNRTTYCNEREMNRYKNMCFGAMGAGLAGLLYSMGTAEYPADDYAMQQCVNPDAWLAAYEFLDRKAPLGWLPGLLHSFTKYRLSRIASVFKEKFGYELTVVPQSLNPKYDA